MKKNLQEEDNFYEIQKVRAVWVWVIIIIALYAIILPVITGILSTLFNIILISIGFGFFWLFYKMYLLTVINEDGIQIKFSPFTDFIIPFNKIKDYKIREYRPIIDYGGWGIRFNKSGKAYTVSGKIGLQIDLSNGKSILIGTQKPDVLLYSVNKNFK